MKKAEKQGASLAKAGDVPFYWDSETYYILTGEGEYNYNGTSWRHVKSGDITFTPDGRGHGLANTGNTDLVFMALIIKD